MPQAVLFSAEEICQQSQQLAAALVISTIALLKDRQLSVTEWFSASRQKYAANWEDLREQGALAVLRVIALNSTVIGATVESLEGDTSAAELVITDWPSPWFLDTLGLSREDTDPFWESLRSMMEYLGYHYVWQRDDVRVRLRVHQGEDKS
ncbi:MAG TPA: hypothetical protein VLA19_15480 [Herpetosiphonaceae bacterium]|nr:hypothetical protein [Herpetosiphonaceae bacterium]